MKCICVLLFAAMFVPVFSLTVLAQKMSKWEKEDLKKEKNRLREYEKLDKDNAQADKEAIASLQKGITAPFISRLNFYFVRDAIDYSGNGTSYNTLRDEKNWETANILIDAAKAIPGLFNLEVERATDSLLLKRTDIDWLTSQGGSRFPANNLLGILNNLRNKDYSPEANIRLAKLYQNGIDIYSTNGWDNRTRLQSFDSAYKFIYTAAVAGSAKAMGMLGNFKIYGDGDLFKKPSPATYKYLDTISAGIWYKKQFDALYANKPTLSYDDSLNSYMLYKIAYRQGDIDTKGVEYYTNNDHKKAYMYWLASATFRNSAFAFYRIGYLYFKGEGGMVQHSGIGSDYCVHAGDLGYAPGYYGAAMSYGFGDARRSALLSKAAALGYKPAGNALSIDNKQLDEMNRISLERTRSRNFYTEDEDAGGNTISTKKGNTATPRTPSTSTCSSCGGAGQQHTTIPGGAKKNGVTIFGEYRTCTTCNGKGYY